MKFTNAEGEVIECTVQEYHELKGIVFEEETAEKPATIAASELTDAQYVTWSLLCDLDRGNGVQVAALARAEGVPATMASQRIGRLKNLGYAEQIRKGLYRALTP